jgi:Family of unknown function (DUF5682)
VLVHDPALFRLVDQWVSGLSADHFLQTLPLVRRTFATFPPMVRRQIGERVKQDSGYDSAAELAASVAKWDLARAETVIPVLRLILGIGPENPS